MSEQRYHRYVTLRGQPKVGYCVESERENGSVHIYPEGMLERIDD